LNLNIFVDFSWFLTIEGYYRKLGYPGRSGVQEAGFDVSGSAELTVEASAERWQKLAKLLNSGF